MAITVTYADDNDGTGGVLTIAGSAGGSSNAVYVSEYAGSNVSRAVRLLATRVGDGTMAYVVAQSGPFLVFVVNQSGSTFSYTAPQVFRAGDGEESPHMQIAEALREMIIDMALPGVSADPSAHRVTKVGARIQDMLDADKKCVFYIPTQEAISYMDNAFDTVEYPVNVVISRVAGQELTKGLADILKARFMTHFLFGAVPIPDLPWVHTVDYRPGVINDASQWLQNYDVSVFTLVGITEVSGGII